MILTGRPGQAVAEVADSEAVARGAYLLAAAGCVGCHTDPAAKDAPLAGGRPLKTPFGVFYGPNITPDPVHGIGRWSLDDFRRALRDGVGPEGDHYYPVFPYPSFSGMTDADIADLWAYLRGVAPVSKANRAHDIRFPFGFRPLLAGWKWIYLRPGPAPAVADRSDAWNRGAYLVGAVGHCGECHTPRGLLGGLDWKRAFAGTQDGPDGGAVPNITPDAETGIGKWSAADMTFMLKTGILPDGDVAGDVMGEVIDSSTRHLTDQDRAAIVTYLMSVPAVRNRIERKSP